AFARHNKVTLRGGSMSRLIHLGLIAVIAALVSMPVRAQNALDDIKKRGTLVVGVKADYKPYGFRDPSGAIVGIEPDLAADVAKRLGVKLELVPVVSSNRMQFLEQGKIDLMIATMNDKPDRRKVVYIVEPSYYASSVNVLAPKSAKLREWTELKGKKVCMIQGAWYNKQLQQDYGMEDVAFKGTSDLIVDWHPTGRIVDLEKKYGMGNTSYALQMNSKYKK